MLFNKTIRYYSNEKRNVSNNNFLCICNNLQIIVYVFLISNENKLKVKDKFIIYITRLWVVKKTKKIKNKKSDTISFCKCLYSYI